MGEREARNGSADAGEEVVQPRARKPGIFSPRNIIIVVVGVGLSSVLAVLTVGNYIAPSIEQRVAEQEQAEVAESGESTYLEKLAFFKLEPLIVNPAGSDGERYLKAAITLEMYEEEIRLELEKRLPQIKNQINNILSSKSIEQVQTNEDKEKLRREILNHVNGMLVTGRISNVYFEEFVYQ